MKEVKKEYASVLTNALDGKVTEKTNSVLNILQNTAKTAVEGNIVEQYEAKAKVNALLEVTVNPKVETNLKDIMSRYGEVHNIARNEAAVIEVYEHEMRGARRQAEGSDVRFGKVSKTNVPVQFETISAGMSVDYRDLIDASIEFLQDYTVELMTSIDNEIVNKVVTELVDNIKAAATANKPVYYATGSGISQTALDEAIKVVRRSGDANIFGDYSVVTQLEDFVGFHSDNFVVLAEERLMEIDNIGYIAKYRGSNVTEIKNALDFYNKTTLSTGKDFYDTLLPESDLFVMANGRFAPNHIFFRGGLMTQKGNVVSSGSENQRWDIEVATHFVEDRAYMLGLIQDSDLA